MPKISTYGIKAPPVGTDMLVGTDKVNTPPNQTKNFTVQDLSDFVTNGLQYVNLTVPGGATVQQLFTNPIELIPAPGVGKAIVLFDFFVGNYPFGGVAYNFVPSNPDFVVDYQDAASVSVYQWVAETSSNLNASINKGVYLQNNASYEVFPTLEKIPLRY